MCRSCSLLPTPQIHEVLSAVSLVMVWPYLTMIIIYDKYRSYSKFCVQCSKNDYIRCVLIVDIHDIDDVCELVGVVIV